MIKIHFNQPSQLCLISEIIEIAYGILNVQRIYLHAHANMAMAIEVQRCQQDCCRHVAEHHEHIHYFDKQHAKEGPYALGYLQV
jgi:hypothetical protein